MKISEQFNFKEVFRFLIGGGSAVLTDWLSYRFLLNTGITISAAKVVSYVLGAAVGFVINKFWTFESKQLKKSEILKYIILYACSAAANTCINNLVLSLFEISVLAFLVATGISTVINFIGQKFFVFRKES